MKSITITFGITLLILSSLIQAVKVTHNRMAIKQIDNQLEDTIEDCIEKELLLEKEIKEEMAAEEEALEDCEIAKVIVPDVELKRMPEINKVNAPFEAIKIQKLNPTFPAETVLKPTFPPFLCPNC